MKAASIEKLVGCWCHVDLDLPMDKWPDRGYPLVLKVVSVSDPMIELKGRWDKDSLWVNLSKIAMIQYPRLDDGGQIRMKCSKKRSANG